MVVDVCASGAVSEPRVILSEIADCYGLSWHQILTILGVLPTFGVVVPGLLSQSIHVSG